MSRLVAEMEDAPVTYPDVGATLARSKPEGFHHDHYELILGRGPATFERAVEGLKAWEAHRIAGVRVFPADQVIRTGVTVVVTLGTTVLALAAPCRVVGVMDGQTRWGFAYGTLPGHPEQGEEAFVVSIAPDDTVKFEIEAFSRPVDPLVRLSGPLGRLVQRGGTHTYLQALQRFVDLHPRGPY